MIVYPPHMLLDSDMERGGPLMARARLALGGRSRAHLAGPAETRPQFRSTAAPQPRVLGVTTLAWRSHKAPEQRAQATAARHPLAA